MVGQENNHVKRLQSQEDCCVDAGSKRRKSGDERSPSVHGSRGTVYRYLCPRGKAGSIIGRGGEIVRQLMSSTEARIIIGENLPGCEERLVTICSTSDDSNAFVEGDRSGYVCPAQYALFKVHQKVIGNEPPVGEDNDVDLLQNSVRLLVPSEQIGHIIGKGGQTIHSIRNDTQAHIRILKNEHLPLCANSNDELIQIMGEAPAVKKALFQVSARLHEKPSGIPDLLGAYSSTPSDSAETVYRCLCAERRIGGIIGKGGEIVNQLRADSQAKIIIGERVSGCRERVVTISSSSEKTNISGDMGAYVCPAEDALYRLHERLIKNDSLDVEDTVASHASLSLLVPSDQIGHIIGKGGHALQDIKSNTGANIRILKGEYVPPCANSDDELLQITGQAPNVMKALAQVSSCLRGRPSRSRSLLSLHDSHIDLQRGNAAGEFSIHPERDEGSSKMFALSLVCPSANIAKVIGKDGSFINKIRDQSGASIKVDSSTGEDDCVILISGKEYREDLDSSTIYAAVRLQPSCSEIAERGYGEPLYITRLLVPTSQIGCLIGKGGSIITEMRKSTRANIRVMSNESLLKVASEDDVLVEISGELAAARNALIQISTRLKAKVFRKDSELAENSGDDSQGGGSP